MVFVVLALMYGLAAPAQAHRDGCHRWHSCPSDSGSYECWDLGYTTYCGAAAPVRRPAVSVPATPPPSRATSSTTRMTTTAVNLRAGPSARTAKVATLVRGSRVNVLSCAAGWCRVTVTGKTGYVAQAYLK